MRRNIIAIGLCAIIIFASSTAFAFDGKRRGFVLGAGIGYAPMVHFNVEDREKSTADGAGFTFLIGYAWNSQNMIVYQAYTNFHVTDQFAGDDGILQMFDGANYYRYFGPRGRAWFLTGGLGRVYFGTEYRNVQGSGFGYTIGGGYEFTKQLQASLHYYGGTSSGYGWDHRNDVIQVLVTVVAY